LTRKLLADSAKNGTEANDKKRLPFGNRGRRELGTNTNSACQYMTLSNDEYRKLQREGLAGEDEMEKGEIRPTVNAAVDNGRNHRQQKISSRGTREDACGGGEENAHPEIY
jgi:hypothetical protein